MQFYIHKDCQPILSTSQLLKKERKKEKKEKGKEWDSCLQLSPAETRLYIPPFIITWFFS